MHSPIIYVDTVDQPTKSTDELEYQLTSIAFFENTPNKIADYMDDDNHSEDWNVKEMINNYSKDGFIDIVTTTEHYIEIVFTEENAQEFQQHVIDITENYLNLLKTAQRENCFVTSTYTFDYPQNVLDQIDIEKCRNYHDYLNQNLGANFVFTHQDNSIYSNYGFLRELNETFNNTPSDKEPKHYRVYTNYVADYHY